MSSSKDGEKLQSPRDKVSFVEMLIHKMESREPADKKVLLKLKKIHKYLINPYLKIEMVDRINDFLEMFKTSKYDSSVRLDSKMSSRHSHQKTGLSNSSLNRKDQSGDSEDEIVILDVIEKSSENQKHLIKSIPTTFEKRNPENCIENNESLLKQPHINKRTENYKEREFLIKNSPTVRSHGSSDAQDDLSTATTTLGEFSLTDNLLELNSSKYNSKENLPRSLNASATPSFYTAKNIEMSKNLSEVSSNDDATHSNIDNTNKRGNIIEVFNNKGRRACQENHKYESAFVAPFTATSSINTGHDFRFRRSSDSTLLNASSSAFVNAPIKTHFNAPQLPTTNYRESQNSSLFTKPSDNTVLPIQNAVSSTELLTSSSNVPPQNYQRNHNNVVTQQSLKYDIALISESRKDSSDNHNSLANQSKDFISNINSFPNIDFEKLQNAILYVKSLETNSEAESNPNQCEEIGSAESNPESGYPSEVQQTTDKQHSDKVVDLRNENGVGLRNVPEKFIPSISSCSHEQITKKFSLPDSRLPSVSSSYPSNLHSPSSSHLFPIDNTSNSMLPSKESEDNAESHVYCSSPRQSLPFEEVHSPIYSNESQSSSSTGLNGSKNNEPRKLDLIRSRVANGQNQPIQLGKKGVVVSQIEKYKQNREKNPLFSKQSSAYEPDNSSHYRKSFSVREGSKRVSFRDQPNGRSFSSANSSRERSKYSRLDTHSNQPSDRDAFQKDFRTCNVSHRDPLSDIRKDTRSGYISRDPRLHARRYIYNNRNMQCEANYSSRTLPRDQSKYRHNSHVDPEHYVQTKTSKNNYPPSWEERLDDESISSFQVNSNPHLRAETEDSRRNNTFQVFQKDRRLDGVTSDRGCVRKSFHNHTQLSYSNTTHNATFSSAFPRNSKIVNSFTCLVMQGLPSCTNSSHIYKFFDQYMLRDLCIELTDSYKCKGTAFVQFPNHLSAKEAIQKENGKTILNHKIYLNICFVGALKQAKLNHGAQNFDRERYLDIPSRPVGTGNPFYIITLNPQPQSHPPKPSVSHNYQESTYNENCTEELPLENQVTSAYEECTEETENAEPFSTENVDPRAPKRVKNFKIPKTKNPESDHHQNTRTIVSKDKHEDQPNSQVSTIKSQYFNTKTAINKITSGENKLIKRKHIELSSNSEKGGTSAKNSGSKSPNYDVDLGSDENSYNENEPQPLLQSFDLSENESIQLSEQTPTNKTITKKSSPADEGKNMSKNIQPLKLKDKTLGVKSNKKLCTPQLKRLRKKQKVNKVNRKLKQKVKKANKMFSGTKITRLKHNLLKKIFPPKKKIPLIIPKPLKFVYYITSEEELLRRKPKSRIKNFPSSPLSKSVSGASSSSTVNVCENLLRRDNLDSPTSETEKSINRNSFSNSISKESINRNSFSNSISKEIPSSIPSPPLLECSKNVKEYFSNVTPNCSSTPKKQITQCEELNYEIEQNDNAISLMDIDSDDDLPDLMI